MLNEKPQQNIDPKTRILHRIGHSLSIKCKKHFYAFFVTLETIKKKNLYLTPQGEFQKIENRPLTFAQKDTTAQEQSLNSEKKQINPEEKKKILNRFVQKMEELNRLLLIKEFEQYTKAQFFHSIKNKHLYKDSVQILVSKLQKCREKLNYYRFLKALKKINQYAFKIEILSTLTAAINKKYNKINPFDQFDIKEKAFSVLKNSFCHPKVTITSEGSSNKDFKSESHSTKKIVSQRQTSIIRNLDSNHKEFSNSNQKSLKGSGQTIKIQDSQFSIKYPLESLEAKVFNVQQRKFDRNQKSMLKSYQIKTCLEEEPMIASENIKIDKSSNFCNKIAKNYLSPNINDKDQQFNTIFTSAAERNTFSSRFRESKVTPYMSSKFARSNKKNFNLDLNSSDEKADDFTISQISGITVLKTDKSTSTLINDKSFNFSNAIGTECVSFKNSLVQERESLKDTDKNFTKKRPVHLNKSQVEGGVFSKSFLRRTFDNKGKAKFIESTNVERSYSSNKGSQLLIRHEGPFTDVKPQNKAQEISWARTSSHGRQEEMMIETGMESTFMKVNMSMLSNQNVYPTRDVYGVVPIDQSLKSAPYVQKQGNQKGEKEKSFIKLLSNKKDMSMISKN